MAQPTKQSPSKISQGMITSDGVVLADAFAQKTDIASGSITPFNGDLDLSGGVGGGTSSEISRIYYAAENGVDPGNSGAANSAALQTLIDTVNAAGGGLIRVGVGTFELAVVGNDPHNASYRHCVEMKSGVVLSGNGSGLTVFKLANAQHSDANLVHVFTAGDGASYFGFDALRITGNTAGQTGYTQGYKQAGFGTLINVGYVNATATGEASFVTVRDCKLDDWFAGPLLFNGCEDVLWDGVSVDNCGEGILANFSNRVVCRRYYYTDTNSVSVGDGLEIVNGSNTIVDGFEIDSASGGSALDMTGNGIRITNGRITNTQQGVVIQNDQANPDLANATEVYLENIVAYCTGDSFGFLGSEEGGDSKITIANCHANGIASVINSRGFLFTPQPGGASGRWSGADITMTGCTVTGHQVGISVNKTNRVIARGCVVKDSYLDGVLVSGAASAGEVYVELEVDVIGSTQWGVGDSNAAFPPQGYVRGNFRDNGDSFTGTTAGAQCYTLYQNSLTWSVENTRTRRPTWPAAQAYASICGEQEVVCTHTALTDLLNGYHGQVTRVVFTGACTVSTATTLNLSDRYTSNVFAQYDSLTLVYDGVNDLWREIAREQAASRFSTANLASGTADNTTYLRGDLSWQTIAAASGDVVGPASATDNAIARYNLTTGKLLQNSAATIDDSGNLVAVGGRFTGAFQFANDEWITSIGDGLQRFHFGTSGPTYFRTGSTYDIRNSSGTDVVQISSVGTISLLTSGIFKGAGVSYFNPNLDGGGSIQFGGNRIIFDSFDDYNGMLFRTGSGYATRLHITATGEANFSGRVKTPAATTSIASLNIPEGAAPSSPADGDMWCVGDVFYRRIGGVTKSITFA